MRRVIWALFACHSSSTCTMLYATPFPVVYYLRAVRLFTLHVIHCHRVVTSSTVGWMYLVKTNKELDMRR